MKTKHFLLLVLVIFASLPLEAQCAMCRAVLESEESGEMAKGINNGIVYLMLFPYLLIGGVGYAVYRVLKKAKRDEKN
jgi:hypothetical protein